MYIDIIICEKERESEWESMVSEKRVYPCVLLGTPIYAFYSLRWRWRWRRRRVVVYFTSDSRCPLVTIRARARARSLPCSGHRGIETFNIWCICARTAVYVCERARATFGAKVAARIESLLYPYVMYIMLNYSKKYTVVATNHIILLYYTVHFVYYI